MCNLIFFSVINLIDWLIDWLIHKKLITFDVCVNSLHPKLFSVSSSVPQGSCLTPFLYALYVNAVVKIFRHTKLLICAGGMSKYAIINSDVDRDALQCDLKALYDWCAIWG